ncbi:MAG: endonuclease/exonuclease/phosphatase family protein [Magnetospirillum sp.]|nr:endonuclease/exonuclease/phosphatase family protein [Magnetospirillum sp.]
MKRLRIATFNMESLDEHQREGDFADRVAVFRPQLQRLRADVVCLQEINAHGSTRKGPRRLGALDRVVAGTELEHFHRVVSMNRGGVRPADRHNMVILSRYPVRRTRQLWHDLVEAPCYRPATAQPRPEEPAAVEWDRPLLHAELELPGGHLLHVVNLHLRAPRAAWLPGQKAGQGCWQSVPGWAEGFFLAAVKQAGQALEARLLVDAILDDQPDALICVCGDFNAADRRRGTGAHHPRRRGRYRQRPLGAARAGAGGAHLGGKPALLGHPSRPQGAAGPHPGVAGAAGLVSGRRNPQRGAGGRTGVAGHHLGQPGILPRAVGSRIRAAEGGLSRLDHGLVVFGMAAIGHQVAPQVALQEFVVVHGGQALEDPLEAIQVGGHAAAAAVAGDAVAAIGAGVEHECLHVATTTVQAVALAQRMAHMSPGGQLSGRMRQAN